MGSTNTQLTVSPIVTELVQALRQELEEYGEMLALLEQQQESMLMRAAEEVFRSVGAINEQMTKLQAVRGQRESCQGRLATLLGAPEGSSLSDLISLLPESFQVAVRSLVRENNELLGRIQRRVRQNHLLLGRSMQLMQQILQAFVPDQRPSTYTDNGHVQKPAPSPMGLYEAIG